jgi:hypothetical protein
MDVSTRPSQEHRQKRARRSRLFLAVLSFAATSLVVQGSAPAATTVDELTRSEYVSSIAQDVSHEVAIRTVDAGSENISVTARLSTAANTLAENVFWEIRSETGELVIKDTLTELNTKLAPGAYVVEAHYGAVNIREKLTLLPGHALAVNFVLNAGGLRVLPLLKDMPKADLKSHTLVYALAGPAKGQLVTHSKTPGEILKLPAGQYRIESRLGDGNTTVVTDVRIRPGRMSAVEVRHVAGLARLSYVGSAEAQVTWDITLAGGEKVASTTGLNHAIALRPGTYLAEAHVNGEVLSARFVIAAGQERDILLGN